MKKIIFGVFAHPDDEAFGPAGTLLLEARNGTELHLICLTAGQNGTNSDNIDDLGAVRLQEWQAATQLIGATKTYHLEYIDGHLDNMAMIEISERIESIVTDALHDGITDIEFMSLDPNGLTGHIDHIVASRAASRVFHRRKTNDSRFSKIRYACIPRAQSPTIRTDWIYMDAGRDSTEIHETVDARNIRNDIIAIMHCHDSQRADCETALKTQGQDLGLNYFIVAE